jgi:general secretion pathway protein H
MGPRRGQGGFTLLEMIVVLAVLSIMIGLIITHGPTHSERLSLEAATREMAASLRLARARAIAQDHTTTVTFTPGVYLVDGAVPHRLPEHVTMAGTIAVTFQPDGSSSGGRIAMRGDGLQTTVIVDWLTGRVRIVGSP